MKKVVYDKEIDAKYLTIKSGDIFETKEIRDWLILDFDKSGDILGIEILDSSENDKKVFVELSKENICISDLVVE